MFQKIIGDTLMKMSNSIDTGRGDATPPKEKKSDGEGDLDLSNVKGLLKGAGGTEGAADAAGAGTGDATSGISSIGSMGALI